MLTITIFTLRAVCKPCCYYFSPCFAAASRSFCCFDPLVKFPSTMLPGPYLRYTRVRIRMEGDHLASLVSSLGIGRFHPCRRLLSVLLRSLLSLALGRRGGGRLCATVQSSAVLAGRCRAAWRRGRTDGREADSSSGVVQPRARPAHTAPGSVLSCTGAREMTSKGAMTA